MEGQKTTLHCDCIFCVSNKSKELESRIAAIERHLAPKERKKCNCWGLPADCHMDWCSANRFTEQPINNCTCSHAHFDGPEHHLDFCASKSDKK